MVNQLRIARGFHRRDFVLWLTLFSHLMVACGFPLPTPRRISKDTSRPFPCQNRPCGCITADQCWKGDCCCFTLEEKLAWAEANGVEPPEHVRARIESRKARPTSPKKKSCCSEDEPAPTLSVLVSPTCCERRNSSAEFCNEMPACEAAPDTECPHCVAKARPSCCEKKMAPTPDSESGVRWVIGIFAQKCRGEGPTGLFQLDPADVPDLTPYSLAEPERSDSVAPRLEQIISVTHSPPTRPPRSH